ncbi:hypothetical protein GXP67_29950 [Rhodocytophaga rosea]|uniref:Uncharacterized protein n=1 Tax=Rhodocytophaga rosea TaxID=2704465 RepID=A0A6C0GR87_9BACT|nr:hypothetical protein [Rhodocytophaga rosea]QHT70576.1 hypothetical protein GXP67_29950 [Rhodocytophaga rosea]
MKIIYNLLEKIKERPSMYLGEKRISSLRTFIDGYTFGLWEYNIQTEEETPPFVLLHKWVAKKFGWGQTSAGWNTILLNENLGDEEKALDQFFEILPEFMNVIPTRISRVKINEVNKSHYLIEGRKYTGFSRTQEITTNEINSIPDFIYVVKFSQDTGYVNYYIKEEKILKDQWHYENRTEAIKRIELEVGKKILIEEIPQTDISNWFKKLRNYNMYIY